MSRQKDTVLTGQQMIELLDKYMYITRDFQAEFQKAPKKSVYECWNFFHVCSQSEGPVKEKFGIKNPKWFMVCVDDSYKVLLYVAKTRQKDKVTARDIREVKLIANESKQVEKICNYKQQFNGHGQDPKCLSI
jgi:hypothetical protein